MHRIGKEIDQRSRLIKGSIWISDKIVKFVTLFFRDTSYTVEAHGGVFLFVERATNASGDRSMIWRNIKAFWGIYWSIIADFRILRRDIIMLIIDSWRCFKDAICHNWCPLRIVRSAITFVFVSPFPLAAARFAMIASNCLFNLTSKAIFSFLGPFQQTVCLYFRNFSRDMRILRRDV